MRQATRCAQLVTVIGIFIVACVGGGLTADPAYGNDRPGNEAAINQGVSLGVNTTSALVVTLDPFGCLTILGTPGDDDVHLCLDATGANIEVDDRTNMPGMDYSFAFTQVVNIHVSLAEGDDWVVFDDTHGSIGTLRPLEVDVGDGDNVVIGSTGSLLPSDISTLGNMMEQLREAVGDAVPLRMNSEQLMLDAGELAATDGAALMQTAELFIADAQQLIDAAEALRTADDDVILPLKDQFLTDADNLLQHVESLGSLVDLFAESEVEDFIQELVLLVDSAIAVEDDELIEDDDLVIEALCDSMQAVIDTFAFDADELGTQVQDDLSPYEASLEGLRAQLEAFGDALLAQAELLLLDGDSFLLRADTDLLGGGDALHAQADAFALQAFVIDLLADALYDDVVAVLGNLADGATLKSTQQIDCNFTTTNTLIGSGIIIGTAANDDMTGGAGPDIMLGLAGRDRMRGGAGVDLMFGFNGGDDMYGQDDFDLMWGNSGDDCLNGDDDIDLMFGNTGNDLMHGNTGRTITITVGVVTV
ncbi:MAG TPA: hypothetical protein VM118_08600, partial [Acidobacteriota bacterium]|nr:hypothetical protein [Acidobacteriota bacterium]